MTALMTSEEVMKTLRVSRNTFWKWKKKGLIKPVNENPLLEVQYRLLFSREDIERIMREGFQPQRQAS